MAWVVLRKEEVEQPTDKSEPSRPETVSPDFQQPVELKNIQQLQHWVHHEKQLTTKKMQKIHCKNVLIFLIFTCECEKAPSILKVKRKLQF